MSLPMLSDPSKLEEASLFSPSASKSCGDLAKDKVSALDDGHELQSYSDLTDGEEEKSMSSWMRALLGRRTQPRCDPDAIATKRSAFDDPRLAPFYLPKQDYENIHRFDPSARWTYQEEKALLRKIDWKIMLTTAVVFAAVNLNGTNISQANSANFLQDLHLTTNDFNLGNTVLRLSFICAELPTQLISKRLGPDRLMPVQVCLLSIVSLSQFWLKGRASFLASRALLGLLQGGFAPQLVLYMSCFYTKTELPIRFAVLSMSMELSSILSSLMAYAIFHLNGVSGIAGWRWLFLIEGLITLFIGIISFFNMPQSPTQTKTWFRPEGWLTEREEIIIVNKLLRDTPAKGNMHNREGLTFKRIWVCICDYDMWPLYAIGLVSVMPGSPPAMNLTLLLRDAGFSTFNTNLLTIPSQVAGILTMLFITFVSEVVNERALVSMMGDLWVLPFLVALYVLPSSPHPWLFFGLLSGLLSHPIGRAIHVGWASTNSRAVDNRTITTSLYSMFVQIGVLISYQIYQKNDAPRYKHGNRVLIILCSINVFLLYPSTKAYYIWRNRQNARVWDAMTPEEKAHYLNTTKDVGNKRLDFRFVH